MTQNTKRSHILHHFYCYALTTIIFFCCISGCFAGELTLTEVNCKECRHWRLLSINNKLDACTAWPWLAAHILNHSFLSHAYWLHVFGACFQQCVVSIVLASHRRCGDALWKWAWTSSFFNTRQHIGIKSIQPVPYQRIFSFFYFALFIDKLLEHAIYEKTETQFMSFSVKAMRRFSRSILAQITFKAYH